MFQFEIMDSSRYDDKSRHKATYFFAGDHAITAYGASKSEALIELKGHLEIIQQKCIEGLSRIVIKPKQTATPKVVVPTTNLIPPSTTSG